MFVYGATTTEKNYFVREYLKLYDYECRSLVNGSEVENDWIGGKFTMFNIKQTTLQNMPEIENCVIVIDDIGDELKE